MVNVKSTNDDDKKKKRSITWCIARLRRLINNSSTRGDSKEMIEQKVAKISQKLDDGLASGNLQVKPGNKRTWHHLIDTLDD